MRRRACHALRQARSLASDEAAAASERARAAAALLREQPAAGPPLIFDRRVKTAQARERSLPSLSSSSQPLTLSQRGRAAWLARNDEPLQREVAERLVERLQDVRVPPPDLFSFFKPLCCRQGRDVAPRQVRRAFPTALVLGGSHLAVAACLGAGLGGVTRLVHLDSSADVLSAVARSPVPSGCSRELVLGDEEAVPLPPASVDVVLACLSLHWLNDLPGCLIQARDWKEGGRRRAAHVQRCLAHHSLPRARRGLRLAARCALTASCWPPFLAAAR